MLSIEDLESEQKIIPAPVGLKDRIYLLSIVVAVIEVLINGLVFRMCR